MKEQFEWIHSWCDETMMKTERCLKSIINNAVCRLTCL